MNQNMINPIAALNAALMTGRPELMQLFKGEMERLVAGEAPIDPALVTQLVSAVGALAGEVYDLRRTVDTMVEANKYIRQALGNLTLHADVSREVAARGRAGNLPDVHAAQGIMDVLKAEREEEEEAHW